VLVTARKQAQASADAGAHAGAIAYAVDRFHDRSSSGAAVQSAISAALAKQVAGGPVSITTTDVTFLDDSLGVPDRVEVQVFRTSARGNALQMMLGMPFGMPAVDIWARAVAEVVSPTRTTLAHLQPTP
jgi:hypothetical protein